SARQSTAWIAASASTSSSSARPCSSGASAHCSGTCVRIADPSIRSITKNGAPNTPASSHERMGRAIETGSSLIALRILYSRSTSCALATLRSEEHTSELQSPYDLVCRLLLEKKNTKIASFLSSTSTDII